MSPLMNWRGYLDKAIGLIALAMAIYHMVYVRVLMQDPLMHQNTHLLLALLLVYLSTMVKKPRAWMYAVPFIILSIIGTAYVFINYTALSDRAGIPNQTDVVIGVILVIVVLYACKLTFGWIVPAIGVALMAYALLSPYLPSPFYHTPISFEKVISWSSISFSGVYGQFLGISANFIILFILFGGLLQATGVSESFMELGKAAGRRLKSGPGQAAVISSGLIGMVLGSGVANVAMTGPITIPLMKKAGYKPEQAGAIEAAASSGGQIMPPVMASAAFLMAGLLGIPYGKIVLMAFIPGIIFFLAVGIAVHFLALRQGMSSNLEDQVDWGLIKRRFPVFLAPLILIIILLALSLSAQLAAFSAIILLLILSSLRKETRLNWRRLIAGCRDGCISASALAVAIATIGVVSAMISLTGVGVKLAFTVDMWSMGIPLLAIFICMAVTVILGCGMPVPAVYALVAIVVAPVLVRMGFPPIQTHFFILYYAAFSTLSPPVASAALMGSKIAGGKYFKTAIEGMKIASPAFILPWLFLFNPNVISNFTGPVEAVTSIIALLVFFLLLQTGLFGHFLVRLNAWERIVLIIASFALLAFMVTMNMVLLGAGLILAAIMLVEQVRKVRVVKTREAQQAI